MSGDTSVAKRYLIVSNDWSAEVDNAQKIVADVYKVVTLADAKNGLLQSLRGKQAILWPSGTLQAQEFMREFSLELVGHCKEVKYLDSSALPMFTPSYMLEGDWNWNTFKDFATPLLHVISEGAATMPAGDGAQSSPSVPNSAAQSDSSPAIPPDEQSRAASSSPGSPAGSDATVTAEPYVDISTHDDFSTGSSSEPPEWASEFPPPDQYHQLSPSEAYIPYTNPVNKDDWPEPLDLSQQIYVAAPLDLSIIPASLQAIVGDFSNRTGIDPAPMFFGLLGAVAGLAPDSIRLQPKQLDHLYTVHPSIWPLAVGGSSSGKSPALEEGMKFIQKKDRAAVLENVRKLKDYDFEMKKYEDLCNAARKNGTGRPEEPEYPKLREYWVSRGTTEGVTRLLEHSSKVTWYVDEVSGLVNGWDAYKSGGKGNDREFVMQLYNGGPGKNVLAGKTISIENASAVICGGTTPSAMVKSAGGRLVNDGFLQRTLLCMVPPKKAGRDSVPNAEAYAAYDRILENILAMPGNATLKFSDAAQDIYSEFCADLELRIAHEDNESLAFHMGKWFGAFGRVALIYAIVEAANFGQFMQDGNRISADIAKQVKAFFDWQRSHVSYFWNELMSDKGSRKFSQTISRYILANPQLDHIQFRDHIARPHWREMEALKPWELKDAINTLITAAWIVPNGNKNNSYGVPSSYQVNPRIEGMFSDERSREIEVRMVKRDELQKLRQAKREREAGED